VPQSLPHPAGLVLRSTRRDNALYARIRPSSSNACERLTVNRTFNPRLTHLRQRGAWIGRWC